MDDRGRGTGPDGWLERADTTLGLPRWLQLGAAALTAAGTLATLAWVVAGLL